MKNLIIVESPAKARTISNFLSKDYKVIASKGHIRDLPKSTFGITVDEESGEFIPKYSIPRTANPIVKEIKALAKSAETIYIATDEDREGEAIGYHIAKAIGKEPTSLPRIVFHEITKSAILHAIANPRKIDMDSINAQQTRRLLDRIVGYKLSPLLASKVQKGLSAGRVQSSTLKIIVDREKEIKAFKPVEFWSIDSLFDNSVDASIFEFDGMKISKLTITNEDDAKAIVESAKSEEFIVASIKKSLKNSKTPPPFMTSTLQQSASTILGMSPKKSMMIAQKLYEGVKTPDGVMGVITYMRTDSLNLAKESVENAREHILNSYGKDYLPPKAKLYSSKAKGAQEAHEAIRPTIIEFSPVVAKDYLSADEYKLYRLIYNRFLASQMSDAKFESQIILFKGIRSTFKATGSKLIFDGFHKVYGGNSKDKLLPELKEGSTASLDKIEAKQNFTEPPPRYNEASIIKVLESLGIGRPSTYAPTISTLLAREYIEVDKKRITPTEIAFTVIKLLEDNFSDIVDSNFTANMENNLDEIAEANINWQDTLKDFYHPFMEKVDEGKKNIKSLKVAIPTGEECPQCTSELLLRKGRYGEFIACSNFPKCKYTKNVGEEDAPELEKSDEKCDKCGSDMVIKESRRGKFLACSSYPKCKNAKPLIPNKVLDVPCPKCGSKIEEKNGKRGNKFFGCQGYPNCKFISNTEPTDKKCPECDAMMGKKELKSGIVYQCLECKHKIKED